MALALSTLLVAVGAILVWGVNYELAGLDVDVIGSIGIVVGLMGFAVSMLLNERRSREERASGRDYIVRR